MRLDVYLFENGLTASRTEAKSLIDDGAVNVNGRIITKPSYSVVPEVDKVEICGAGKKYVSRGGLKLEGALAEFDVEVKDKLALDIGASSGGFTDCLLQNGAKHVIAVDSGFGQMSERLRCDSRVTVIESFNARYMQSEDLEYSPELVVMDVSFISATCIIPAICRVCAGEADFICLVKPQFEVGRSKVGKGGIVKDDTARKQALEKVISFAEENGCRYIKSCVSPIKGGNGNMEFLAHFVINK